MESSLAAIGALPQKDKTTAYLALLSGTLAAADTASVIPQLALFVDAIVADQQPQVVARQVLDKFVEELAAVKQNDGQGVRDRETRKDLMSAVLVKVQPKVVTFEEQVCKLREMYADLLEEDEEWSEAAKVLIGIPLEAGHRAVETEYKLQIYIRIVRLFLEEEDSTSAETYFNRASLIYHTTSDKSLQLYFKLSQARMFDYNRRFAESSSKYHEISYVVEIDENERLAALSAAITCAVLAPAGPNRSRILSNLYRDERSASTPHHTILSKMFLDQIIRPSEVTEFASTLKPHQLARLPSTSLVVVDDEEEDGMAGGKKGPETVLDRAVMEHNVLSASKIYNNITFKGLGLLLSLTPSAAEALARNMIQQKRLLATLDQVDGLLLFDDDTVQEGMVANVAANSLDAEGGEEEELAEAKLTKQWDRQIRSTLQLVESIAARCEVLLGEAATKEGEAMSIAN